MLASLEGLYDAYVGRRADARLIVDTMNIIGRCVVAGGIRRSAQIAFGEPDDEQFLDLKQDREKVMEYRWVSNNSIFAEVGMDYSQAARRTADNGEPGYLWLGNARAWGRMKDPPDHADAEAMGSNPCVEQTLWDRELCCLVETYPARHGDLEDYKQTLEVAYQYAKTVTLVATEDAATNAVMLRNRRIGCSMTGSVQVLVHFATEVMGKTLAALGVPIQRTLEFTSPIYLMELLLTARHFAQSPELYGAIQMSNPQTAAVTGAFIQAAEDLRQITAAGNRPAFAAMFADVGRFFGDFTERALEQSDFLIDRLVERT
jgi:hypothetical protein